MKNTWFNMIMFWIERADMTLQDQDIMVTFMNRRLGRKVCGLWSEDYDAIRDGCLEKYMV
jgi:hypothetical protein